MSLPSRIYWGLVFSCTLVALHAAGYGLCVELLTEGPVSLVGVVAPTCFFGSTYAYDRVVRFDPVADRHNHPHRVAFSERWAPWFRVLAPATFLVGLVLAARADWTAAALYVAPLLAMPVYGGRLLPATWRVRRLKDVPGVKGLYTSTVWVVVCVLLPVAAAGARLDLAVLSLCAWVFLRTLANVTAADSYDVDGDLLEGAVTPATLLGRRGGYRVAQGLNLLAGIPLAAAWALGQVPAYAAVVGVVSVAIAGGVIEACLHQRPRGIDRWTFYASEAEGLVIGVGMGLAAVL